MVVKARAQGLDVTIDQYPYTAKQYITSTLLPDWTLTGNNDSIKLKLQNKTIRKQCSDYMLAKLKRENWRTLIMRWWPITRQTRP